MGMDVSVINFIKIFKPFGETLTLGRQEILTREPMQTKNYGKYCEQMLLDHFGSTCVDSIDNSNYEGATIVTDMNLPWKSSKLYDTVMDLGTMEHIFNVPQVLDNIKKACKNGGQIIHILPANNFCGHGFYQFSPELFYSYYTEENGFIKTEVYIENLRTKTRHYIKPPINGHRATFESKDELYVMVRTIKNSEKQSQIQQSDYNFIWKTQQ